ncbi:MAG: GNAT family N-acetyltransferase [Novosphingobium sp.]
MASKALRQMDTPRTVPDRPPHVRIAHNDAANQGNVVAHVAGYNELCGQDFIARWDTLARKASEPNPFFESWYLLPSLECMDPQHKVSVLAIESGTDELVGLMPLQRNTAYYKYPFPHVRNWVHPNIFLGTPLVAAGHERAFWRALLSYLDGAPGMVMFAHLAELGADGPLYSALASLCPDQDRPAGIVHSYDRATLRSDLGAEAYYEQSVNKKRRKEFARRERRLGEEGSLTIEFLRDDTDIESWIDAFLALESAGWKGDAGSALRSTSETARLARVAMAGAAKRGLLDRVTLRLDGRMIGALTSFMAAPGGFGYKTAYDERYARYSPGLMLQRAFLKILEQDDVDWCDSCAAPDHPMIDHFWRERRRIVRVNVAIGGPMRRTAARILLRAEHAKPLLQGKEQCQ